MPGKLFLDPARDGTHAYKPIVAHAYCEGALAERRFFPQTAPPGLDGEALDNWLQGWADSYAGIADEGCGLKLLGPELIFEPRFLTWDGAANPDNFPEGWSLSGQTALSFYEPAAPSGFRLQNNTADAVTLTRVGVNPVAGQDYCVRWEVGANVATPPETLCAFGGAPSVILDGAPGVPQQEIVTTVSTSQIELRRVNNTADMDQTINYLSVRACA